jgi:hypothetical protein
MEVVLVGLDVLVPVPETEVVEPVPLAVYE